MFLDNLLLIFNKIWVSMSSFCRISQNCSVLQHTQNSLIITLIIYSLLRDFYWNGVWCSPTRESTLKVHWFSQPSILIGCDQAHHLRDISVLLFLSPSTYTPFSFPLPSSWCKICLLTGAKQKFQWVQRLIIYNIF